MTYCIILVTCEDEGSAGRMARGLVEAKLAACAQIHPVTSIYTWEGEVHTDPEFRLVIKTRSALYPKVEAFVTEHHPYEVPQIIKVPIESGLPSYLDWIEQNTLPREDNG